MNNEAPKKKAVDHAVEIIKASTAFIPGDINKYLGLILPLIPSMYERRVYEFLQSLALRIDSVKLDLQAINRNEELASSIARAIEISKRNHSKIKIGIVRDCITFGYLNKYSFDTIESLQQIADDLDEYQIIMLYKIKKNEDRLKHVSGKSEIYNVLKDEIADLSLDQFIIGLNKMQNWSLIRLSKDINEIDGLYEASSLLLESDDPSKAITFVVTELGSRFSNEFIEINIPDDPSDQH